jgi:hypothetical protein
MILIRPMVSAALIEGFFYVENLDKTVAPNTSLEPAATALWAKFSSAFKNFPASFASPLF